MSKLFTFGCSYTEEYETSNITTYQQYKKYRGGTYPKTWAKILSEKLSLELFNYGMGGSGNMEIFQTFCNKLNEIGENDTIIIGWCFIERFRWADSRGNQNTWKKMGPGIEIYDIISKITHQEICINRGNPLYVEEVYGFMKIIDEISKLKKFSVYYWSADNNIIYSLPEKERADKKFLLGNIVKPEGTPFVIINSMGGKVIKDETNNEVIDFHNGEKSHIIQADLFYNHIMFYKTNLI